jgi:hypothetical protein
MSEQTMKFLPGTTLGKWSVGLIVLMPILFVIGSSFSGMLYDSVQSGRTILADISARPFVALTMLAGMAAGIGGFITGLLAIIKSKEKTLLVYLSTILGGLLIVYLIAELAFPH